MAYEHHCMKLIDIGECESMYKKPLPTEMKLVVDTLNDFIMNSNESTIWDYHEDDNRTFKMTMFWLFRDDGLGNNPMATNKNWVIASNFEDGNPAYVLDEEGKWLMRPWMSECGDLPRPDYGWQQVVGELLMMLTG